MNTKSSTEAELVGISDYLPYNIQIASFLKEQGYELRENVLHQDNQSAMKMAKNGRNFCTGNSQHVNIRYFFVKDRVDKKEITIEYCPTQVMLADYFTKPLQGTLFHKMRRVIMGWDHVSTLTDDLESVNEKRVGKTRKTVTFKDDHVINMSEDMSNAFPLPPNHGEKNAIRNKKVETENLFNVVRDSRTYADVCSNKKE